MRILVALALLYGLMGCTRYEYNITQPPDLAQHIGRDERIIRIDPLIYRMQTFENRLVMRIENPNEAAVQIRGDQSWIVTPAGESRALGSQPIAPNAHAKLILPPMARRVERSGPTFGIGFGISSGGNVGTGVGVGAPLSDGRTFVYDVDATWDWPGGTSIRLHLVIDREGETFTHDLTIDRQRM